jgi:hypothetical protein
MSRRTATGICVTAIVAGAILRALPSTNDFWLDEVWTYFSVMQLASPLEVFTKIHHSNNHHLNSLLFYLLGDQRDWSVYRIPSLLAGIGSIALAAGFAARRGALDAVFASLLTAFCFALIHFSSEARGYATAVFFALAGLWLLELDLEHPRRWCAALFGACAVLGLLSQLVFLFFYAGALVHSARRLVQRFGPGGRTALHLARLHLAPLFCIAALYWVDLRHMRVGGGSPTDLAWLLGRSVGFALGLPVSTEGPLPLLYAVLVAAILALGLRVLWKQGDDLWLLHLITIVLAPLAVMGLLRPDVVAVRYLLIGIAFGLLLAAGLLADGFRAGGTRRVLALAALGLFLAGNAVHTWRFIELGRGGFLAALNYMAEHSTGSRIVVGSDHDFRNGLVLRFYARRLPPSKTLDYRKRGDWPAGGPEWFVAHRSQRPAQPARTLTLASGERFERVAEFDHAAISGFYWALYRNASARARFGAAQDDDAEAPRAERLGTDARDAPVVLVDPLHEAPPVARIDAEGPHTELPMVAIHQHHEVWRMRADLLEHRGVAPEGTQLGR